MSETRTEYRVERYCAERDDWTDHWTYTPANRRKEVAAYYIQQLAEGETFRVFRDLTTSEQVSIEEMLAGLKGVASG